MAKQKARAIGLWIKDGTEWDYLLSANSHSITLNNESIDITSRPDSLDDPIWMQSTDGMKSYSISAEGFFQDDPKSEKWLRDRAMSLGATGDFRILIPNLRNIDGKFRVSSLEWAGGDLEGMVTWSMTLDSVGEPTRYPQPFAPSQFEGERANPSNSIRMNWAYAHDPSITKYQLKINTGAWTDVTGSGPHTTQIVRTIAGTNISLQLRAVNADGNSAAASATVA